MGRKRLALCRVVLPAASDSTCIFSHQPPTSFPPLRILSGLSGATVPDSPVFSSPLTNVASTSTHTQVGINYTLHLELYSKGWGGRCAQQPSEIPVTPMSLCFWAGDPTLRRGAQTASALSGAPALGGGGSGALPTPHT